MFSLYNIQTISKDSTEEFPQNFNNSLRDTLIRIYCDLFLLINFIRSSR
jgi:hypothetical protein